MRQKLFIRYWPTPALSPVSLASMAGFEYQQKPLVDWVLFVGERLKAGPQWCYLDQLGASLPDEFQHGRADIYLIFPSELVNVLTVTPPTKQSKHLHRAVGFMLEEQLVDDPEQLHFALGNKRSSKVVGGAPNKIPVAVISKLLLEGGIRRMKAFGLMPTISFPDVLLIPDVSEHGEGQVWSFFIEPHRVVVRSGTFSGVAMNLSHLKSALAILYRRMLARCAQEAQVDRIELTLEFIYQRESEEDNAEAVEVMEMISGTIRNLVSDGAEEESALPIKVRVRKVASKLPALAVVCQSFINNGEVLLDLLQGNYKPKSKNSRTQLPWRRVAAIAAVWLIFKMGLYVGEAITYAEKAAHYQEMSVSLFKEINPDVKKIRSVKKQLQAMLVSTGEGNQIQFLPLLEKTGGPIANLNKKKPDKPLVTLNQINYDAVQGLIKLDLHVSGFPILDSLKLAIEKEGLQVEIDRAAEDDDRVKVKLKVKA